MYVTVLNLDLGDTAIQNTDYRKVDSLGYPEREGTWFLPKCLFVLKKHSIWSAVLGAPFSHTVNSFGNREVLKLKANVFWTYGYFSSFFYKTLCNQIQQIFSSWRVEVDGRLPFLCKTAFNLVQNECNFQDYYRYKDSRIINWSKHGQNRTHIVLHNSLGLMLPVALVSSLPFYHKFSFQL